MPHSSNRPIGVPGWGSRVAILSLLGMAALVLAGRSLGAVTPHLVVTSTAAGPGQTLSISASRQKVDDPIGRVQFYVPTGFTLDAPGDGGSAGKATARVVLRDVNPNAELAFSGAIVAVPITDPALVFENTNCDGSQHLAAWMVHLKGSKGALSFPIFVDAGSQYGPYVLVACFRPPDVAASDPNRSSKGAVVDSLNLALTPFFRPTTTGGYLWRSLWTPFTAGAETLNTSGNVEAQSTVAIPSGQVVIFGKKSTAKVGGKPVVRLTITGQVLVGGEPQGPVRVTIRHGAAPTKLVSLGSVVTGTDGGYTKVVTLLAKKQYFQAVAELRSKDLGSTGCQSSFPNVPCLDATAGAGRTVSGLMLVKR
jgi:hypothetical protein